MDQDGSTFVDVAVEGLIEEFPDIAEHIVAIKKWYESDEGKRQVAAFMARKDEGDREIDRQGPYSKAATQCAMVAILALIPAVAFAAMANKHGLK
ncbi:hypothetical protein QKT49_gp050 [Acanthamoeba castellanii medusavirus]|uniref:Uncharacterized protein n=1 Tax=Acanthamoeba castellanii medusavirus J1 TaxID=3114988 RepID=A0A3T1CWH3_9VIRU|nr:hypothetical protein QKT49_gp050 [Acanthamoeba castellanii medusavirus]BBI30190.1 hypothetical protein [Acanthamoeba castellanii medusavirus J1]